MKVVIFLNEQLIIRIQQRTLNTNNSRANIRNQNHRKLKQSSLISFTQIMSMFNILFMLALSIKHIYLSIKLTKHGFLKKNKVENYICISTLLLIERFRHFNSNKSQYFLLILLIIVYIFVSIFFLIVSSTINSTPNTYISRGIITIIQTFFSHLCFSKFYWE